MRMSVFLPVKNMVYDALEYAGQVENSARSHREAKQWPSTSGEYLTGFYKNDRLIPVITAVVYFGSDTWNAPRSLHEMLSIQDPELLSLVPDYRINLFSPAEIKDEELDKLQSNLKEVMLFIKYSKDKRKLQELTSQTPGFRSLELKAARVIDSITGINLRFTETEGSVNMCQAVQEMCDDARAEGLSQSRAQGLSQGLQEHALLTAQRMLEDPRFSPEDISRFSGLPLEDVLKLRENGLSVVTGLGPIQLMSPFRILNTCGSSSTEIFLISFPIFVTLGSSALLKVELSLFLISGAFTFMERSLYILKIVPSFPLLFAR